MQFLRYTFCENPIENFKKFKFSKKNVKSSTHCTQVRQLFYLSSRGIQPRINTQDMCIRHLPLHLVSSFNPRCLEHMKRKRERVAEKNQFETIYSAFNTLALHISIPVKGCALAIYCKLLWKSHCMHLFVPDAVWRARRKFL